MRSCVSAGPSALEHAANRWRGRGGQDLLKESGKRTYGTLVKLFAVSDAPADGSGGDGGAPAAGAKGGKPTAPPPAKGAPEQAPAPSGGGGRRQG